jgi:general secretion pathway protein D
MNRSACLLSSLFLVGLAGCDLTERPAPPPSPYVRESAASAALPSTQAETQPADTASGATILKGSGISLPAAQPAATAPARGDISFNFPSVDVATGAKAILGDILKLPFEVAPGVNAQVTLVSPYPMARSSVLGFFEAALRPAGLALVARGNGFLVLPVDQARTAPAGPVGFGSETITLNFVGAEAMRKLIDPVLPGVVSAADPTLNSLTISGTSGQRASVRDLLRQFDVNWLRGMSFALYVPQRSDSRLIVPELDKLLNSDSAPTKGLVRLIAMDKLNGVLAISPQAQYLEDVRRWVEVLDREGQNNEKKLFVYRVQNGRSDDLARVINRAFGASDGGSRGNQTNKSPESRATGNRETASPARSESAALDTSKAGEAASAGLLDARITSDETNNAIIVFATPRDYAIVEEALRKLDVMPVQVMIEAAITEVNLTDALRFGVQWSFREGDADFTLGDATASTAASALARTFPGFSVFYSNNNDVRATLNALEGLTTVNVISAPKLLVINNQTAALQVGNQVPVSTGSAVSVQNGNAPIVNSIEYRDTGVILKVTPRVNSSGMVHLDILQEVSDVVTSSANPIDSPIISTRKIASSVAVQDGNVIALGGLILDSNTKGRNGLPYLSRVPVLGPLAFGRSTRDGRRTELIVLLRPRVIRGVDDGRAITDELRAKIRGVAPYNRPDTIP